MAKFSIECPKCGSINQAFTGLFAKKKIICGACGEEFEVKASRMTSRVCPQCGNIIVCDQARIKGKISKGLHFWNPFDNLSVSCFQLSH